MLRWEEKKKRLVMQAMEHPNCPANLSKFPKQKDNEKECRKAPTSPCVNGSLIWLSGDRILWQLQKGTGISPHYLWPSSTTKSQIL